ncbi:helix-turn-helix domain-containing protein [Ekhidna sp.]|uniref:helix-turn-helix domain-containing protein n=1 Tax=Ekhidna sp. TaxID=2608089 RepID=UPI003CCB83EF
MKNDQIASKIRALRTKKGWSQEALADQSGINHRTVQRIENGESKPTGDTIKRLASALNVAPDELIDWPLEENHGFLLSLNLASLTFIPFPPLGILIPSIMWISRKDKVQHANKLGIKIINFQINWFLLLLTFTVLLFVGGGVNILEGPTFAMFFKLYLVMYLINVFLIILNTIRINLKKETWYPLMINILR